MGGWGKGGVRGWGEGRVGDGENREQATAPCRVWGLNCDLHRTGGVLFKRAFTEKDYTLVAQ